MDIQGLLDDDEWDHFFEENDNTKFDMTGFTMEGIRNLQEQNKQFEMEKLEKKGNMLIVNPNKNEKTNFKLKGRPSSKVALLPTEDQKYRNFLTYTKPQLDNFDIENPNKDLMNLIKKEFGDDIKDEYDKENIIKSFEYNNPIVKQQILNNEKYVEDMKSNNKLLQLQQIKSNLNSIYKNNMIENLQKYASTKGTSDKAAYIGDLISGLKKKKLEKFKTKLENMNENEMKATSLLKSAAQRNIYSNKLKETYDVVEKKIKPIQAIIKRKVVEIEQSKNKNKPSSRDVSVSTIRFPQGRPSFKTEEQRKYYELSKKVTDVEVPIKQKRSSSLSRLSSDTFGD